jgi:hypothetical protein
MIFPLPPTEEEIGLINGVMPDSKEEYWVAQALWKYEIPFMYQYQIMGGYYVRGGQVVDFLVFNPDATPLEVNGNYWHEDEMDGGDRIALVALQAYFHKDPIVLWGEDAQTKDDVFAFVRRYVAH